MERHGIPHSHSTLSPISFSLFLRIHFIYLQAYLWMQLSSKYSQCAVVLDIFFARPCHGLYFSESVLYPLGNKRNQTHYKLGVALNLMLFLQMRWHLTRKLRNRGAQEYVTPIPLFLSHFWHLWHSIEPPVPFASRGQSLDLFGARWEIFHSDH